MSKKGIKPATYIYPAPAMLISSQGKDGKPNIATISWGGVLCSDPPMVGISVRPKRHTNTLIKETMEFVLNIPSKNQLKETDYCGSVSGRDVDKFSGTGFTAEKSEMVDAPFIKECPINLECQVRQIINLGSHDLFIAEVVSAHVDEEILEGDRIGMDKLSPISYCPVVHEYRAMGEMIGSYGFSKKGK
jgi:flavin reductase (DIM6/NTAB) family NADH-FMN oxidoreductase RutF